MENKNDIFLAKQWVTKKGTVKNQTTKHEKMVHALSDNLMHTVA